MKKTYVSPATESLYVEMMSMVCATNQKYKFNRFGRWGATIDENKYGNDEWVNESFKGTEKIVGGQGSVEMGGDDEWDLENRGNAGLWD